MPKILVSACLAGSKCNYRGEAKYCAKIQGLLDRQAAVLVCPESLGGLTAPREPSEIRGVKVYGRDGRDVTAAFEAGAQRCLELALKNNIKVAILKANSPSCGCHRIYDGSFSGKLIPGQGIAARLLISHGIKVYDEQDDLEEVLR